MLRLSWGHIALAFAEQVGDEVRHTVEEILRCCLCKSAWIPCGLPVKLGGLGVSHPSLVHAVAFLSSSLCEVAGDFSPVGVEVPHEASLLASLNWFQNHVGTTAGIWTVWNRDGVLLLPDDLDTGVWLKQKTWMDLDGADGADR